jgi:acyl-CoA synthetase (AMP-forming)/AMP-acid ligase II
MEFNLADLFEAAADAVPDRAALIVDDQRRTFRELDERANRLAHHLAAQGVGQDDHVGVYAFNCVEWVETFFACFKLRAILININYRYVEEELRYLFDNADLVALVHQRQFAPRVAAIRDEMPALRHLLVIEDGTDADTSTLGSVPFEDALAAGSPARDFGPRSGDDRYVLYTGGTTGMPKGVIWRQEDIFFALGGGIDAMTLQRVTRPEELAERAAASGGPVVMMHTAPLMHGAAQWGTLNALFAGNTAVLVSKFDAEGVWDVVARERVNVVGITGDAMARPLADALEATPDRWDLSCVLAITSSAAVFSPVVKQQLLRIFPNVVLTDAMGSSEGGLNGIAVIQADSVDEQTSRPLRVPAGRDTTVLDDDLQPVVPGSGVVGRVARAGNIPVGYYKDPEKTAATFVEAGGRRWSIPGDMATNEADGTITVLGRGSMCINTGGEKVYPEEVEGALKSHPDVFDALVVGVPDERWGQRVTAVVQPRPGRQPTLEELDAHCRDKVAGYKVPRALHLVPEIARSPSGKPDYPWAREVATKAAAYG